MLYYHLPELTGGKVERMKYTEIDGANENDVGKYVALQNGVCPMGIGDTAAAAITAGNDALPKDAIGDCTAELITD